MNIVLREPSKVIAIQIVARNILIVCFRSVLWIFQVLITLWSEREIIFAKIVTANTHFNEFVWEYLFVQIALSFCN